MKESPGSYVLREIKIEVTHACPLVCVHCSSDAGPDGRAEMKRADCERIIAQAAAMGVSNLTFSGGEPLVWPYLEHAVAQASSLGLHTSLYSSGVVEQQASLLRRLADAGLKRVAFSVYSAKQDEHERITRIRGSYTMVLNAIRIAREVGLDTEVHFVPLKFNYRQLPSIADLGQRLGASRISVLRFVPQGRGSLLSDQQLSRVQNVELREMIVDLRSQGYEVRTGSPYNFLMLPGQTSCLAAKDRLVIGPDLCISPCDAFKQVRPTDIGLSDPLACLDEVGLEEAWNYSIYLREIRRTLALSPEEPCFSCKARDQCHGGCLAQKAIHYGQLTTKPDPMCLRMGGSL